jgi:lysophospholipase L1-like esterase
VKSILCYGDSNTWGCIPRPGPDPGRRFPPDQRWPGVLRSELGPDYWVVEEGLNGRTTVWDDGLEPHRNGRKLLPPALISHKPLDLVILMLGTNDLKRRFGVSAGEVADGAGQLVDLVRASDCGPDEGPPQVLLVCPAPLARLDLYAETFEGAPEKSQLLAARFEAEARSRSCPFLDAGAHIASSDTDGIHLDREAHGTLGRAVAAAVRELI